MPASLTRDVAQFSSGCRYGALPKEAVAVARLGFTDFCGTMLAGVNEPAFRIVKGQISVRSDGEAHIVFGADQASAPDAALLNSIAGHALAYDDIGLGGHPSAVLVPAILAAAEAIGADGKRALAAYVTGYEVWAHLIERDSDNYEKKGWHTTAAIGVVAATAAVANLYEANTETTVMALAISASMTGGIAANFQTYAKTYQVAHAASAAILAVRLAKAGMTASDNALEHPAGLLSALSPKGRVDLDTPFDRLGQKLKITEKGLTIKKYPMCFGALRAIDAMVDMAKQHNLSPDQVRAITVSTNKNQQAMLRYHEPKTPLEACFSIEFAMASSIIARGAGLAELTDDFIHRADVKTLGRKVKFATVETSSEDDPRFSAFDQVEVELVGGETLRSPKMVFPSGHRKMPLSQNELWEKFSDCAHVSMPTQRAAELFEKLQTLDRQENLRDLARAPVSQASKVA